MSLRQGYFPHDLNYYPYDSIKHKLQSHEGSDITRIVNNGISNAIKKNGISNTIKKISQDNEASRMILEKHQNQYLLPDEMS